MIQDNRLQNFEMHCVSKMECLEIYFSNTVGEDGVLTLPALWGITKKAFFHRRFSCALVYENHSHNQKKQQHCILKQVVHCGTAAFMQTADHFFITNSRIGILYPF